VQQFVDVSSTADPSLRAQNVTALAASPCSPAPRLS
jgi:hypothetical protein